MQFKLHIAISSILAMLALAPSARADCEVSGRASLARLRVRVAGAGIRTFAVEDLPIAVRPGHGNLYRQARVLGPIGFEAHTDGRVPWSLAHEGRVAQGLLHWTSAATIEDAREHGEDEVEVRVRLAPGVVLGRLRVPCSAMRLGAAAVGPEPPALGVGARWIPQGAQTWISSRPGGEGTRARLEVQGDVPVSLVELGRERDWVRVAARFEDTGAQLDGWVRATELRRSDRPSPAVDRAGDAYPIATAGACGRRAPRRNEYVGPATVLAGTLVRANRDGAAWASVPEDAELVISWRAGDPWARIVQARGLRSEGVRCSDVLHRAWIPRRNVRLQGE